MPKTPPDQPARPRSIRDPNDPEAMAAVAEARRLAGDPNLSLRAAAAPGASTAPDSDTLRAAVAEAQRRGPATAPMAVVPPIGGNLAKGPPPPAPTAPPQATMIIDRSQLPTFHPPAPRVFTSRQGWIMFLSGMALGAFIGALLAQFLK